MPAAVPREVRAFTLGLIMGVGGSPYKPREITRLVKERFGVNVATGTIANWKASLPETMAKYKITPEYVKEVIDRGLFGDLRKVSGEVVKVSGETVIGKVSSEVVQISGQVVKISGEVVKVSGETVIGKISGETVISKSPLSFTSLADVVSYMEQQGFIVATNEQDLRNILDKTGVTLLEKGALKYGPEIISVDPIELDFELVGKQIAGNPVIMWYYALSRKMSIVTGEEPPELHEYVTGCVVDAMVARRWNMAVLRA